MTAHRAWRLYFRSVGSGSNSGLAELQFRATSGGAAIAGGTVIKSAENNNTTNAAVNAFDANTATVWQAAGTNGTWIGKDWGGGPVSAKEIAIIARNDSSFAQAPILGEVQWSDDLVTWYIAWQFTAATWTIGATQVFTEPAAFDTGANAAVVAAESVEGGGSKAKASAAVVVAESIEGGGSKAKASAALVVAETVIGPPVSQSWVAVLVAETIIAPAAAVASRVFAFPQIIT